MKTITIKTGKGNVDYIVKDLDFTNIVCDMEDYGVDILGNIDGKMMSLCRAMVGIVTGEKDKKKAGAMLSEHMKNGGSLEDIFNVFMEAMEEAGFGKAAEETATEAKEIVQVPVQVVQTASQGKENK